MKLIGRGSFSKVYKLNDNEVFIKSEDYIKEAMAHGWFPEPASVNSFTVSFPEINLTEYQHEYTMQYFDKVRAPKRQLKPAAYEFYKELREVAGSIGLLTNPHDSYSAIYKAFGDIKNEDLREFMREGLSACSNYGSDIGFEISPRNIAATEEGDLVLLDCFFIKSQLLQIRSNKRGLILCTLNSYHI